MLVGDAIALLITGNLMLFVMTMLRIKLQVNGIGVSVRGKHWDMIPEDWDVRDF